MSGILYGIGVGPGDPELLTLKALRILRESDVIAIPSEKKKPALPIKSLWEPVRSWNGRNCFRFPCP